MEFSVEELEAFLAETDEGLAAMDHELLALERNASDRQALGRAFRLIHTIKGTSSFLGLDRVQRLAHAGESLLAALRDGGVTLDRDRAALLLQTVDALRGM